MRSPRASSPARRSRRSGRACSCGIGSPASRRSLILAWAMSRATTIGPVSITRVRTGCLESSARISRHRAVEVDVDDVAAFEIGVGGVGQEARRVALELLEEDAFGGDLAEHLAVGRARHGDRHRAARAVPRQAHDAHVVAEVLAAELGADAGGLGEASAPPARARGRGSRDRAAEPSVGRPSR